MSANNDMETRNVAKDSLRALIRRAVLDQVVDRGAVDKVVDDLISAAKLEIYQELKARNT